MITLVVAVLALVFSLAGTALGAFALMRSDEAVTLAGKATAAPPPPVPAPTTEPAPDPTTAPDPTDDPAPNTSSGPADLNPTAQYEPAYNPETQRLTVRIGCPAGSGERRVDLDRPQVGDDDNWEIAYAGCEPGKIRTNDRAVGKVDSLDATPFDCQERIRTAPDNTEFAPQEGATFCLFTSQNDAVAQGITQKVVFVRVDGFSKDGNVGVLNITVKAWVVPQ